MPVGIEVIHIFQVTKRGLALQGKSDKSSSGVRKFQTQKPIAPHKLPPKTLLM
jgi:hypothetical protein